MKILIRSFFIPILVVIVGGLLLNFIWNEYVRNGPDIPSEPPEILIERSSFDLGEQDKKILLTVTNLKGNQERILWIKLNEANSKRYRSSKNISKTAAQWSIPIADSIIKSSKVNSNGNKEVNIEIGFKSDSMDYKNIITVKMPQEQSDKVESEESGSHANVRITYNSDKYGNHVVLYKGGEPHINISNGDIIKLRLGEYSLRLGKSNNSRTYTINEDTNHIHLR